MAESSRSPRDAPVTPVTGGNANPNPFADVEKTPGGESDFDTPTIVDSERALSTREGDEKTRQAEEDFDVDVVDWDGPDDVENPQNWPEKKKWALIAVMSIMTLVTPLGSSMFAPGIPKIMVEFNETSSITATFMLSVYILGFAFGPLFVAPLSETYGRAPCYHAGNLLFTVFSVGAALSNSMGMLMAFRFLMGLSGSVPITIGSGTIADVMPVEKRGTAMAAWAMGPLLGPCIGPVAGGYLIAAAGWRWVYWLIVILAGIIAVIAFFTLNETYAPVLLQKKTNRLIKETGNTNLRSKLASNVSVAQNFKLAAIRPMKLLILTPIVTLMATYMAITYGILYLLFTTFSFVYAQKYGFDEGASGTTFLPAGIGMFFGIVIFGAMSDVIVRKNQAAGIEHRPEFRLIPKFALPAALMLPAGLFLYGWTIEYSVHWIVPMIGVVIFSCGLMGTMVCVQNYLLDAYPRYAASVTAALAVLRSLAGAFLPLGGLDMYTALGLGWGNSLLGFVSLALVPIPLLFYIYGPTLRKRFNPNL
ncbi:major facilitator superfamily domain-containing protein [Cercophora newfieldiana]|uniref:Major facilitator superfamily domain-containing protein n=1 Tax=Cercophora newfieldiana TaxID=92897 RepID=A0AA39Y488_9PEZI|nr:major facilitator superfamily domain-containing protein [Cercophora newfieldiana]